MKGSGRVTEALNELLTLELTVVNQHFLHSRMCENWGYKRLAKRLRDVAFEEMKDAERIIDRILFLEAVPKHAAPRCGDDRGERPRAAPDPARGRTPGTEAPRRRHQGLVGAG